MMENPEELLHTLEEFSKYRPKDIPRELEDYLCFVAKTGDPVYQWPTIKNLFREKLISVITDFYEACPSIEIPPCPNVDVFNYDTMKSFILEKLDAFSAAPFTIQRICELLTAPRKEYNRIDKYMRALEKNILVVSTIEPGNKGAENGESIVNGLESEHLPENSNSSIDVNVVEMDEPPTSSKTDMIFAENQATNHSEGELPPVPEMNLEMNFIDNSIMNCEGIHSGQLSEMGFREIGCHPSDTERNESENEPTESGDRKSPVEPEEPVVSTEMNLDVTESSEVQQVVTESPLSKDEENEELDSSEAEKSADSTSIYQTNDSENATREDPDPTESPPEEETTKSEVASSECENVSADSMQENNSEEIEQESAQIPESNEVTEEQIPENVIDTTEEKSIENGYDKDEEITSSNKIPVGEVNTTQIEANEHEAEAKEDLKFTKYTEESTNEVTASSEELVTSEAEQEKIQETQANEAEASSCEAI